MKGESRQKIAESLDMKLGRVSWLIYSYRIRNGLPGPGTSRHTPISKKGKPGSLAPSCPCCIAKIETAIDRRECRHWEGDIRDGDVVLCGQTAAKSDYCGEHYARFYTKPTPLNIKVHD
jgi:hypothetical protein